MGRRISNENVEKKIFLSIVFYITTTGLLFLEKFQFSAVENNLFLMKKAGNYFFYSLKLSKNYFHSQSKEKHTKNDEIMATFDILNILS